MRDLIEFLQSNANNRGVLAALRRGLVQTTEFRAWPWLATYGGIGQSLEARAVRTVAGLFSHHPCICSTGNMGDTCRALCSPDEHPWDIVDSQQKGVMPGPMSRKFSWLLSSNTEEICDRTMRLVLYAKSKNIPINYVQLEEDLRSWPKAREAWALAFWGGQKPENSRGSDS